MESELILAILVVVSIVSALVWRLAVKRLVLVVVGAAITATLVSDAIFWAMLGESPHWSTFLRIGPICAIVTCAMGVAFFYWQRKRSRGAIDA